jgi:hypothetical protein
MLKLYGLLTRRGDLDLEAFRAHWRGPHRDLALRLVAPGIMRGYVQNHRVDRPLTDATTPADGCPELWVDDLAAVQRLGTCPEYLEGAYLDEPNFMDGRAVTSLARLVHAAGRPRAPGTVRLLRFLPAGPPRDWTSPAPWELAGALPVGLERERCLTEEELGAPVPYAAIESSWWPDETAARAAWALGGTAVRGQHALLVRELVVVPPP